LRQAEHFQRILATLGDDLLKRAIHDALGNRLLAALHDRIHKLGDINIARTSDPAEYRASVLHDDVA
jgi:hypothetical protein